MISDLHYDKRVFKGVDESRAWPWLLEVVDHPRPDLLLSCGNWGMAISPEEFEELLRRTTVLTIYGNHENVSVLAGLRNVRDGAPVLMEDARIYEVGGVRIAGISGIIASRPVVRKGVPRKLADDYVEAARKLKGSDVDVLLIHEIPALRDVYPGVRVDYATTAALEAIRVVAPKLVFNGHMHHSLYTIYRFGDIPTLYVRVDSSQKHRHYAIYHVEEEKLEIWGDIRVAAKIHLHAFQGASPPGQL